MNGTCGVCDASLIDGAHLCHKDTRRLDGALRDVPALAYQLDVAETRMANVRSLPGPTRKGAALPWNERAAKAREELEGLLWSWAAYTRQEATLRILETVTNPITGETMRRPKKANPEPPRSPRAADVAIWLTGWLHWLRRVDTAPDAYTELTTAIRDAAAVIDAPEQVFMVGVCRELKRDEQGEVVRREDGNPILCGARLYAPQYQTAMECPRCHEWHDVRSRREQALARAEDFHRPAAFMTRFLVQAGYSLSAGTIRKWAHRGLIHPTGTDPKTGHPVYRVGDVLDVYAALADRRADRSIAA